MPHVRIVQNNRDNSLLPYETCKKKTTCGNKGLKNILSAPQMEYNISLPEQKLKEVDTYNNINGRDFVRFEIQNRERQLEDACGSEMDKQGI